MSNEIQRQQPLRIAIVGCGAISEQYYAPALLEAGRHAAIEIVCVLDPTPARRAILQKSFPAARAAETIPDLLSARPELAIVASPPRFHAEQAGALLAADVHVLSEKPMADTVTNAETMIAAARSANRLLAVGLFRRFFPALQNIKALVANGALGAVLSFHIAEGGPFNWPAASASFFRKNQSQGGVLLDLGIHVLDLVQWWFGEPAEVSCADDAMGNLEANSAISLKFASGLSGVVRVSRDTPMSNQYVIRFERGTVVWRVGDANHLDVQLAGVTGVWRSEVWEAGKGNIRAVRPDVTYHQSFVKQLLNVFAAVRGEEALVVSGEEGVRSLRLVERCYQRRTLMPMPWLTPQEVARANALRAAS